MKYKKLPSQEYLHSILNYNPKTGIFTWKWRNDVPTHTNATFVNKIAGTKEPQGYWVIKIHNKTFKAHRLAWVYIYGDVLNEFTPIDHKNRNITNNRIRNLRLATESTNCANSVRKNKQGFFKGVTPHSTKFQARIMINREPKYLGTFNTPEDASVAYYEAAKKYFGEFARAS